MKKTFFIISLVFASLFTASAQEVSKNAIGIRFGAGIGSWKEKVNNTSETFIFGAGDIGIEYNFEAPVLISLDFRPEFGFSNLYKGFNSDIALSVRYQF